MTEVEQKVASKTVARALPDCVIFTETTNRAKVKYVIQSKVTGAFNRSKANMGFS